MDPYPSSEKGDSMEKPVTPFRPNVIASLSYLLGWVSALAVLTLERKNSFVRLHAIQSLIVSGILTILFISLDYIGEVGLTVGALLLLATPAFIIMSMIMAYRGRGLWIGRATPRNLLVPPRRRSIYLFLAVACFLALVVLLVSSGLLGVRDTLSIVSESYVTATNIGPRQEVVPPDWWLRQKDWQTVVLPGQKISFRYELDNQRFSQYSTDVEATLWTVNTEVAPAQLQEMVLKVFSQSITVAALDKVQMEWVIDTSGLKLGDIPQPAPPVSGTGGATAIPGTSRPPQVAIGPPPAPGTSQVAPLESYPIKYAVHIKQGEIERKVLLFFYPPP